ncbi:NfeD family protein [Conchiformibius steedae]|uniref:NfeD family protein n=1 Tax=Conchiformibius steedae TaxID=153493 RepID=A0A3P2A0S1_9NEIS|nr:NfeD family protein [Conchiformibius steedae]RRD89012.1 NfeD family protein [Conchiformibius steedae]
MTYWLAAAALLFAAEIFLGTVYLLVLSAALAGAGLAAWLFGADSTAPWWTASLLSLAGVVWVYRWRRCAAPAPAVQNDLDIGQSVTLESELGGGLWRVQYRGTQWEARFPDPQHHAHAGNHAVIIGKDGIVLLLRSQ